MTFPIVTTKSDCQQPVPGQQTHLNAAALVIFDSRVDDLPQLLAGLRPGVSAHVLDPDRDGIEQISQLMHQQPTASLTLVAHGFPGGLQLGSGILELNNLNRYSGQLRDWFRTVARPQLTLLACHVAAGDAGSEFVETLAVLTEATVTAAAREIGKGHWPPVAAHTFRQTVLEQYAATLVLTFKEDIKDGTLDNGSEAANRLFGTSGVTVSPDGTQVFVTSAVDAALLVFDRDAFGNLTFSQSIRDSFEVEELFGAFGVTVSPDGTQVFVASVGDHSLTVFRRENGTLTRQQLLKDGRDDIERLEGAIDVAIAPDGQQVYVVSLVDSSLTVLDRDTSGNLTFRRTFTDGVLGGGDELAGASGVAVSPDGTQVLVTSHTDGAITVFDRDASGNLTLRQTIKDGTGDVQSLFGASGVAISPDGQQVYVASATDAALTVFDRRADGTLSFAQVIQDGDDGAELFGGNSDLFASKNVTGIPTINGFSSVTVSPDGQQVFVVSFADNALTVFDRDTTGRLTLNQVIQDQDGRNGADELAGVVGVALSPDNQQVFVASINDDALTVFDRDLAPSLLSITRQTPITANTDADSLVFRATFDESILNIDPADFSVTGGSTAIVTAITSISATVYDITVTGGDLADFNGIVGLDLAASQDIQDPIGNRLPTQEPAVDDTYTLTNTPTPTTAKLTPLSGLEVTGLGDANTVRLQVDQVNISDVGEILIFSVDTTGRTQIASFSLLEGGQLADAYAPSFSIDNSQVSTGQFLEFELVVNGLTRLATPTAISDAQISLDFGDGTQLIAETFTQTTTTNLLVGDATAIDLSGQTGLVNVEFTVYRSAARANTVGFYTTDFADGGIRDVLTNSTLRPGDAGYREAALANQLDVQLSGENGQVRTISDTLTGGDFLGIFLVAGGGDPATGEVFFSHAGANANGNDHAKLLGDNTFGFEDLSGLGDGDFNDVVVEFAVG
ncbi:DUF4347 domain-containing protein [Leptolyngbya cf. ectocarpi LEGE 11479]|uniref:DUF4347 domain-containing protein n=1 Tax=Leptolyngbya cf. ectocarpi LEGE 11479 TaxID=1828722 RepID=A0A928ZZI6_LEPEC|nr:DUF4347 domain-containing protein [Leptolyngbya ectocarpi]MBE9070379.1 DUF4347 domain-containing protein [Leptolyngbya cf. ectocarpi LEGE 11479]